MQFLIMIMSNGKDTIFVAHGSTDTEYIDEPLEESSPKKQNSVASYTHNMKKQKLAIKAWSKSLSEQDYNASEWARY